MDNDCIFCKIINGEAEGDFVYKGENIVAFRDISPSAPVHILIVPKKHIRGVNDLEDEDSSIVSDMLYRAKEIAREQGIDKSGYKLVFNVERGGGQFVFHIHLHLIGGWSGEGHPELSDMPV